MRKLIAVVTLVAVGFMPTARADSELELSEFEWASVTVSEGSHLQWYCDIDWDGRPVSTFAMLTSVALDGTYRGEQTAWGTLDAERTFLHVKTGDREQRVDLVPVGDFAPVRERHLLQEYSAERDVAVKAGWASWGKGFQCDLLVDGMSVARTGDPSKAAWLTATDFSAPAAIDGPMTQVATAASLKRRAEGHLLGMFTLQWGAWRAHGPNGERFATAAEDALPTCLSPIPCGYVGSNFISLNQPTNGEWTYYIDTGLSAYSSSAGLWLLEIPD